MGDVLRTTTLLNVLDENITWFTKPNANPLLANIPQIKEIVTDIKDISGRDFDVVLNLDDDLDGCAVLNHVNFEILYGFYEFCGKVFPMPEAQDWWAMSLNGLDDRDARKQANRQPFQHYLFKNVGRHFNREEYVFGYPSKSITDNVVGIETRAGDRWPMKIWPHYDSLQQKLKSQGFEVKMFEQKDDIRDYIKDINSCKVVVSGDSLAMHIAIALKKKTVGIFGPTNPHEIEMYGRGEKLFMDLPCSFCFKKTLCSNSPNCMNDLSVDAVYAAIERMIK